MGIKKTLEQKGVRTLFFGLGAQRAGSTWIHKLLSNHPDVHVPQEQKELHYWSTWYFPFHDTGLKICQRQQPTGVPPSYASSLLRSHGLTKRRQIIQRGEFLANWHKSLTERDESHSRYANLLLNRHEDEIVVGEITPGYALLDAAGFSEMQNQHNDVRFIYIMRDPLDRLRSAISYSHSKRIKSGQRSEIGFHTSNFVKTDIGKAFLRHSQYNLTIKNLESVIDPKCIHYCFFETMRDCKEVKRLCNFLSIDASQIAPPGKVNASNFSSPFLDTAMADAREALEETYQYCLDKFKNLPDAWSVK